MAWYKILYFGNDSLDPLQVHITDLFLEIIMYASLFIAITYGIWVFPVAAGLVNFSL